ncbi:Uncharacterised protein [Bordetella pertussis]|nr:Uncharacterised protein [Bordetella pertussis]
MAFSAAIDANACPEFLLSPGTVMPVASLMALSWVAQSAHSGGQL